MTKLYLSSQLFPQGLCIKMIHQGKFLNQKLCVLALWLACSLPSMKEISWELHESNLIGRLYLSRSFEKQTFVTLKLKGLFLYRLRRCLKLKNGSAMPAGLKRQVPSWGGPPVFLKLTTQHCRYSSEKCEQGHAGLYLDIP